MNPLGIIRANLLACVLGLSAAIFLVISVWQSVELNGFLWIPGLKAKYETSLKKLNESRAELKRISTAKDEQKAETDKRINQAERHNIDAEGIAGRIEKAPPTLHCATPSEIMGADL